LFTPIARITLPNASCYRDPFFDRGEQKFSRKLRIAKIVCA
jgi:hypothetical protein